LEYPLRRQFRYHSHHKPDRERAATVGDAPPCRPPKSALTIKHSDSVVGMLPMPFSLEELQAVAEVTSTTIRTPIDGLRAAATRVVQRHQELTPQDIAGTAAPEALHRRPYRRKKPAPVRPSRLDPFVA